MVAAWTQAVVLSGVRPGLNGAGKPRSLTASMWVRLRRRSALSASPAGRSSVAVAAARSLATCAHPSADSLAAGATNHPHQNQRSPPAPRQQDRSIECSDRCRKACVAPSRPSLAWAVALPRKHPPPRLRRPLHLPRRLRVPRVCSRRQDRHQCLDSRHATSNTTHKMRGSRSRSCPGRRREQRGQVAVRLVRRLGRVACTAGHLGNVG